MLFEQTLYRFLREEAVKTETHYKQTKGAIFISKGKDLNAVWCQGIEIHGKATPRNDPAEDENGKRLISLSRNTILPIINSQQ